MIHHVIFLPQGFRWQLTFSEIRVRADWWFRYNQGWLKISDQGNARATLKNLSFDVTLKPKLVNGTSLVVYRQQ